MIPLPTKMAAIAENRKFDKKNHLKSSPLKLTWPIGIRLWWNGPCVAHFQNYIRWPRLPNKICFSPLTLPGEFLNIFYMNYAFDLTQIIAKTNIYTSCSSSNICICCSLCGFLWFGWLVHFKVHYEKSQKQNVLGDSMCISINRLPAKTHHFYLSNDWQDDLITSPNTLT
jgi:hypothetical protein